MVEITELFSGRIIRQRKPEYYVKNLYKANFQVVKLNQFEISRRYNSARELVSIIKSFPFIEGFLESDEAVILKRFGENAIITSDPFILVANKLKGDK